MPPHNETAAKRALRNKDAQRTQDESLAVFLTNRNRAIPSGLKRSGDGTDGRQERNVRRRDSNIAQDTIGGGSQPVSGHSSLHDQPGNH